MDESIICLGVFHGDRLYYDGKYNQYFVLTSNFRVTRYPKRVSTELGEWCDKVIESHKRKTIANR